MADIKRIVVGNSKYPSIAENDIKEPMIPFDFSREDITFDTVDTTFDEQ